MLEVEAMVFFFGYAVFFVKPKHVWLMMVDIQQCHIDPHAFKYQFFEISETCSEYVWVVPTLLSTHVTPCFTW